MLDSFWLVLKVVFWFGLFVVVVALLFGGEESKESGKRKSRHDSSPKSSQQYAMALEMTDGSHKKFTINEIDHALDLVEREKKKAEKLLKTTSQFSGGSGRTDLIKLLRQERNSLNKNLKELEVLNDHCEIADAQYDRLSGRMFDLIDDIYTVVDELDDAIRGPVGYQFYT